MYDKYMYSNRDNGEYNENVTIMIDYTDDNSDDNSNI